MTDQHDPSPPLANARRELFAVLCAANPGGNRTDAFRRAGFASTSSDVVASSNATLTAQHPSVAARLAYLATLSPAALEDALRAAQERLDGAKPRKVRSDSPAHGRPPPKRRKQKRTNVRESNHPAPLETLQWAADAASRLVEIARGSKHPHPLKRALGALSTTSDLLSRLRDRLREVEEVRAERRRQAAVEIDLTLHRIVDNIRAKHGLPPAEYPDPEPVPDIPPEPLPSDLDSNWATVISTARGVVDDALSGPVEFCDVVMCCDALESAARAAKQLASHTLRAPDPDLPPPTEPPPISRPDFDLLCEEISALATLVPEREEAPQRPPSCSPFATD